MNLLSIKSTAIIISIAMSVALGNTTEGNDRIQSMRAFQDTFQEYLQSKGQDMFIKLKDQVDPAQTVSFSGDGNSVAIGTWKKDHEGTQSWHHSVEVYRNNNSVWELVNEEIKINTKKDGEGYDRLPHLITSLSHDGNAMAFQEVSSANGNGNTPRPLQFYENLDGTWEQIHDNVLDWQTGASSSGSRRRLSLDRLCADTLAPSGAPTALKKTDTPTLPAPRGRSRTALKLVTAGTCQPMEEMAQGASEGAIEGFYPGVESTPGGMMPRCGEGEGRGRGLDDLVDIFLFIDQPVNSCTPQLPNEEVLELVEKNKIVMKEKMHDTTGLDLEVIEVALVEAPTVAPSAPPSTSWSPTTPEMRTFFIKSTYQDFNSKRLKGFYSRKGSNSDPWCLQPESMEVGARFVIQKCEDKDDQKFFFDQYNQLRIRSNPSFCMRWTRKELFLGICLDDGSSKDKANFVFDEEDNTLIAKKKSNDFVVGFYLTNIFFGGIHLFLKDGKIVNENGFSSWLLQYLSDTEAPSMVPSASPSLSPTSNPSVLPSLVPTSNPTASPSLVPTSNPTASPSLVPTEIPTKLPSKMPTAVPTPQPTPIPTPLPTPAPTPVPTLAPTNPPTTSSMPTEKVYTSTADLINDVNAYCLNSSGFRPIGEWNVAQITDFTQVFSTSSCGDLDLTDWNTAGATTMLETFLNLGTFNGDISTWDTSSVTTMESMFSGATSFNGDISLWDTSTVASMDSMFSDATSFTGDLSLWNTSNVASMSRTFSGATSFNGDVSNWDTGKVLDMTFLFINAASFNRNLSSWNTSKVTSMQSMIKFATIFNTDVSGWNTIDVTSMRHMFNGAESFNGNISSWYTTKVVDMNRMFLGTNRASAFNQNLSNWDTSAVTDFSGTFLDCASFDQDVCSWGWHPVASGASTGNFCSGTSSCGSLSFPTCV